MSSRTASKPAVQSDLQEASQGEEAIRLEGVSVRYRVPSEQVGTFKEYMIRRLQGRIKQQSFLALNDISLSVGRGEVFGLVGQNGAGKSTLLKLVARVLRPSTGRVVVKGRVAPLLEIGAGFHPELTGRENVYLNGAMLGFTRQQMAVKFPEIVDFAELGDFIDAPLRTYSSGMWARLGFAVATAAEPEILIVDEILAVGDEAFRRKSAERIQSFRDAGATILLVSHNMGQIESMCQRAAWLDHGRVVALGSAKWIVDRYLGRVNADESEHFVKWEKDEKEARRWGSRKIEITRVGLLDDQEREETIFHTGQRLVVEMEYQAYEPVASPIFGIAIHRQDGTHITGPNTTFAGLDLGTLAGSGKVRFAVPRLPLLEGLYYFSVAATDREDTEIFDYHDRLYPFRIDNRGQDVAERYGVMTVDGEWQHL